MIPWTTLIITPVFRIGVGRTQHLRFEAGKTFSNIDEASAQYERSHSVTNLTYSLKKFLQNICLDVWCVFSSGYIIYCSYVYRFLWFFLIHFVQIFKWRSIRVNCVNYRLVSSTSHRATSHNLARRTQRVFSQRNPTNCWNIPEYFWNTLYIRALMDPLLMPTFQKKRIMNQR